jgi:serine/threonine-protein kinase
MVGDCVVRGLAGRGRTAAVYLGQRDGEDVAIKLFHEAVSGDPELRARVRRGTARAARLSHRHLLRVYGAETHDDRTCVVTAWVAGTSLARFIAARRAAPAAAARVVEQLARAVAACHYEGIVHGALTPKAVLIDSRRDEALIDDLERPLSVRVGDDHSGRHVVRDLAYAAPWDVENEQATASGDVYALGCILHALLVGSPPTLTRDGQPGVSERMPRAVRNVILSAVAVSPAQRYPSASAMARDLENIALTLPGSARLDAAPEDGGPGSGRRWRRVARGGVRTTVAAAGVGALVAVLGQAEARRKAELTSPPLPASAARGNASGGPTPATRRRPASPVRRTGPSSQPSPQRIQQLVSRLPVTWTPVSRRGSSTNTLRLRVPGTGSVQITYRRDGAGAPSSKPPEQERARGTRGRVEISDRLRARGAEYAIVATAADRAAAARLARTARQAIADSARPRTDTTR